MLLQEIKNIFHLELDELYPKEEVDSFFQLLIEYHLHLERFILAIRPDFSVSKEDEQPLFEALSQLKLYRPIQYIMGKTTFMDLEFFVDEHVLVPRPETEELVRWVLDGCSVGRTRDLKILDIGTGSGCIAIAIAKNILNAEVFALDVSHEAIQLAKRNAQANEVQIELIKADILSEVSIKEKFDIIVSNPPYVRALERKDMSKNVLEYEPDLALFVPDGNPLLFFKSIVEFAQNKLSADGLLYLEINQYLAEETQQLLEENNFQDIELRKDMFGNNRMLKGKSPL